MLKQILKLAFVVAMILGGIGNAIASDTETCKDNKTEEACSLIPQEELEKIAEDNDTEAKATAPVVQKNSVPTTGNGSLLVIVNNQAPTHGITLAHTTILQVKPGTEDPPIIKSRQYVSPLSHPGI